VILEGHPGSSRIWATSRARWRLEDPGVGAPRQQGDRRLEANRQQATAAESPSARTAVAIPLSTVAPSSRAKRNRRSPSQA
jgi:hypothetical protein